MPTLVMATRHGRDSIPWSRKEGSRVLAKLLVVDHFAFVFVILPL